MPRRRVSPEAYTLRGGGSPRGRRDAGPRDGGLARARFPTTPDLRAIETLEPEIPRDAYASETEPRWSQMRPAEARSGDVRASSSACCARRARHASRSCPCLLHKKALVLCQICCFHDEARLTSYGLLCPGLLMLLVSILLCLILFCVNEDFN